MTDMSAVPLPPHSIAAEQSVLGALLLDNSAWHKVQSVLDVQDCYLREHQYIFKAMKVMFSEGKPVDIITLSEFLRSKGKLEDVGGLGYLATLARETPSAANIVSYANVVRDKSILRQLIGVAGEISSACFEGRTEAKEVLTKAENLVFKIAQDSVRGKRGFAKLRDVLREVMDTLEANLDKPANGVLGVTSGFGELDAVTSGFGAGDVIVVAARPSMGKTTFAMNLAESAARSGVPVAVFSMEMEQAQLGQRVLASSSSVPLGAIRKAWTLRDEHWASLSAGVCKIGDWPIYFDDSPNLSVQDIRSRLMRLNTEIRDDYPMGVGMIVIDYLQLMASDDKSGIRNNEIEEITRGIKKLAKEFGVPIVELSQLNRSLESRPNKRPVMSDLRDSGGIEQDADMILFLYRDEVYNKDSEDRGFAEVIVGKNRNGPLSVVRLGFDGECTRFRSLVGEYD
ncbi:MAG: replicative DNA helicase [Magnetococcus sp. YQC-3]